MAHSTIHFAFGLWLGTICFIPAILMAVKQKKKTAGRFAGMIALSWFMALIAAAPGFMRAFDVPAEVYNHPVMNIFLFHPLIDKIYAGGMLKGQGLLVLCFCFQYALLLIAIKKTQPLKS